MNSYVYCLEKEGVPFYIGITKNIKQRISAHKTTFGDLTYIVLHEIFELDIIKYNSEKVFWEEHYMWLYKSYGFRLINKTIIHKSEKMGRKLIYGVETVVSTLRHPISKKKEVREIFKKLKKEFELKYKE